MRLIDADEVINILKETGIIQDNDLGQCVIAEINRIPTAYDVDKVIEEIEEWTARINVINDNSSKAGQVDVIGSNKAIKIVEGGGVND